MPKLLLLLSLLATTSPDLSPNPNTTCCEKGNPPKCYQCWRAPTREEAIKELELELELELEDDEEPLAQAGFRCVVERGGQMVFTQYFTTREACIATCQRVAINIMLSGKGSKGPAPVTNRCTPGY